MTRAAIGLEALSANQEADIATALASLPGPSHASVLQHRIMSARGEANRIAKMLTAARFALNHAIRDEAKDVAHGLVNRPGCGMVFEATKRVNRLERELAGAEAVEREAIAAMDRRHAA